MVGVAVLVGQRVAARNRARIGALHLGERLAHQPEAHVHGVAYALGLALGAYQSVKLVVDVGVAERTAQRFLLLILAGIGAARAVRSARPSEPFRFLRCLWCNNVGNAQNIVYGVVFILCLHDAVSVGREQHALQPLSLAVIGVRAFRAVAHARVYGVPVLVVAHLRHDRLFPALLGRPDARYLTRCVVAVGNHLPVGIGHGAHAVVAVVCCGVDVGAHVGLAHHHRANRLHHLALVAVVVGLAARGVLHQHEPARAVVLGPGLAVGVGNAVEEVLGIEYLAQPFVVVGVGDGRPVGDGLLQFRRELGEEVACGVVGAGHFARIGMVHAQLMPQQVVLVGGCLAVGVMHGEHLPHGIVAVLHPHVAACCVLHRLSVAPLLVGVAFGVPAQRIGDARFEHRFPIVVYDGVGRRRGSPVGQRNLGGAVVGVVFGGGLQVAHTFII